MPSVSIENSVEIVEIGRIDKIYESIPNIALVLRYESITFISQGKYKKSYVFAILPSIYSHKSLMVYLFGMLRIMRVVRGSRPI